MVGYRNDADVLLDMGADFIRHSDGGVSEHRYAPPLAAQRLYQAFRWWGIGTPGRTAVIPR